jgi:hypothetical protein
LSPTSIGVEALRGRQRHQTSLFEARPVTGTQESHPRPTTRPPSVGKTLKDSLPEKRFDDEFFVAVDWLRKQSGRKKQWRCNSKIEVSAPLPKAAAGADELVPDPMVLGELRAIRRWNRWLAARGHAAASVVFRVNLSIGGLVELSSSSLLGQRPTEVHPVGSPSRTRPRATTYIHARRLYGNLFATT